MRRRSKRNGAPNPASLPGAVKWRAPKGDQQNLRPFEVATLRWNPAIRARLRLFPITPPEPHEH